jgi:hypothetical protein
MTAFDSDLEHCLWALANAATRWQHATEEPDTTARQFAAVGEALFWATALDEQHEQEHDYQARRSKPEAKELMEGMRYARNRVTHGLVTATTRTGGMTLPLRLPATFSVHWVWRPAAEIPPPASGQGRSDATNGRLAAYTQRWEGREVGPTLTDLHEWLATAIR